MRKTRRNRGRAAQESQLLFDQRGERIRQHGIGQLIPPFQAADAALGCRAASGASAASKRSPRSNCVRPKT